MRRSDRALAVIAILTLAAACSKQAQTNAAQDASDASHSAKQTVSDIGHNPAVKRAGADVRLIVHGVAVGVRQSAARADTALHRLAASSEHTTRDRDDRTNRASDNS